MVETIDMAEKPASMRSASEGRLAIYLPPELARALGYAAVDRGVSKSAVVVLALQELFRREPPTGGYSAPTGATPGGRTIADAELRARELARQQVRQIDIAAKLNAEGFRTARGREFNVISVGRLLRR